MKQYIKEILISLLDKYEHSKVSDGNNQIRVSLKLTTDKVFPKYFDNEAFELREKVNEAIEELISKEIRSTPETYRIIDNIYGRRGWNG